MQSFVAFLPNYLNKSFLCDIITMMENNSVQEPQDKRPSAWRVVLWALLLCALFLQSMLLAGDGEWDAACWLLLWELLCIGSLCVLRRRRGTLFPRRSAIRVLYSVLALGGAPGLLLQSINLWVADTYFTDVSGGVVPLAALCLVLSVFLPAVVVLLWLPPREEA